MKTILQQATKNFTPQRNGLLQRKCACSGNAGLDGECAECREKRLSRQGQSAAQTAPEFAPPIVNDVLRSPGLPLDAGTRTFMESRLGHDFGNVRVHADSKAAKSAQGIDAQAYTVGKDVVFGPGQYSPRTMPGKRLLAHELTHTVQQTQQPGEDRPVPNLLEISKPDDAWEFQAARNVERVTGGAPTPRLSNGAGIRLQRQAPAQGTTPARSGATPQPTPTPSSRATRHIIFNVTRGRFGRFDAELDRRLAQRNQPCRLTLTVKVRFNPINTPTPWPAGRAARWQNEFIRVVSNRWSFRYLLAPTQPCRDEPCKTATAIVRVVPVTSNPHHTVNMIFKRPRGARSSVGATSSTLYEPDVRRDRSDLRRGQAVASHEFGHMLGLPHVRCNTNNDECYGTNREESADVMGRGEIVTERDYAPFADMMSRITGCAWQSRARGTNLFPSRTRLPLAILGGLFGGIVGAVSGGGLLGGVLGGLVGAAAGGLLGHVLDEAVL